MAKRLFSPKLLSAVGFASLLALVPQQAEGGSLIQITHDPRGRQNIIAGGSGWETVSYDGKYIAFFSSGNLTGQNPNHSYEVFLFDRSTRTFVQVTNTQLIYAQDGRLIAGWKENLFMSRDGKFLAFLSSGDPTGRNPDYNDEVFLFDRASGTLTQVTDTKLISAEDGSASAGWNESLIMSRDGDFLVFLSLNDLVGENPDYSPEIFLYHVPDRTFTQVTHTAGTFTPTPFSREASHVMRPVSITADGRYLIFSSSLDLVGNHPNGQEERKKWLYSLDRTAGRLTRITELQRSDVPIPVSEDGRYAALSSPVRLLDLINGTEKICSDGHSPSLSYDGRQIAFQPVGNPTGQNPDGSQEIFLCETATGGITQVTDSLPELLRGSMGSIYPRISADGSRIAFLSDQNLTGENPGHFIQVFLFDRKSGLFAQVTRASEKENTIGLIDKVSGDGRYVVFSSHGDLTGQNPDGNSEIFLFEETPDTKWLQAIKEQEPKVKVRVELMDKARSAVSRQVTGLVWADLVEMLSLIERFDLLGIERIPPPPSPSKKEKEEPDYLILYFETEENDSVTVEIQLVDFKTGKTINSGIFEGKPEELDKPIDGMFSEAFANEGEACRKCIPVARAARAAVIKAVNWIGENTLSRQAAAQKEQKGQPGSLGWWNLVVPLLASVGLLLLSRVRLSVAPAEVVGGLSPVAGRTPSTLAPVLLGKPAPYAHLVRRSSIDGVPQEIAFARDDILIGRGKECDVIISHASISRQHARVKKHKQGYVLFDLKSKKGTYVNGRPIVENLLKEGWVVRLGEVEFVFYGTSLRAGA